MSVKGWLTTITLLLLALVIYFGRNEIVQAWALLDTVNIWILLLLIPIQLVSYYTTGGMIFSYLRSKGNISHLTHWQTTRMALELNFVNHILPSGGAAGFSYMAWVLGRHGVSAGRATMAQIIRFGLTFVAFIAIMLLAMLSLYFDNMINKVVLTICVLLVIVTVGGIVFVIYAISNHKRLIKFSNAFTKFVNKVIRFFTRGKKQNALDIKKVESFFTDLHQDYLEIKREKKILITPFIWAVITNIFDVALLYVAFCSLGYGQINPCLIFIAFGASSIVGVLSSIPGGAGAYEAVMIGLLASAGVPTSKAIAGTLLARVMLLGGTILFGYIFYQLTVNKYGKAPTKSDTDS